ncbi:DUF2254 domain-containing protein [Aestuariicoccus sp. MJ-SS9]|uniref:DUF2254 domain-containing protein n=1 Tax=Aestuariicoccus sp. MJ-SS9 TaxID=3079855 RepID=UPI0029136791|nr:DUF2254 domain-containing protein [Aestuariicoccus sp. MJ-SS9]MDU8909930.1 DUF2254 domain-containing protein [Aestuariicoccus sp. MJ-SS9]
MLSKPLMLLRRVLRELWVRVLLMMLLALLAVALAPFVDPVMPEAWKARIDRDAVLPILTILASSMLAVTTFSLGVMVQAFQAASSQATPRAYRVLMQDTTTHTVLATFVGAFLFSLLGVVMFRADLYGESAAVVVFGMTVAVIALIIVAILRWIGHLSLGSMDHALSLVTASARGPLLAAARLPALGAHPMDDDDHPPKGSQPVPAARSGYVQFVDVDWLQEKMEAAEAELWITAAPRDHVLEGRPVARVTSQSTDGLEKAFTIADERSMEQDARYGLVVLSEIAARALSPGINDPGTAIDALRRLQALLWEASRVADPSPPRFDRLHAPRLTADQLLRDAYSVIVRDGRDKVEVMRQMLYALDELAQSPSAEMREAAHVMQRYLAAHVHGQITVERDRKAFAALLAEVRED